MEVCAGCYSYVSVICLPLGLSGGQGRELGSKGGSKGGRELGSQEGGGGGRELGSEGGGSGNGAR